MDHFFSQTQAGKFFLIHHLKNCGLAYNCTLWH
jgi:hypothetical protein